MTEVYSIGPPRTLYGPTIDREYHRIALSKRNDHRSRLHAWALFGQHEFAALKILSRFVEKDRQLERENVFAIEILVKAIVVAFAVSEQQWRGPGLSCRMTTINEGSVIVGETNVHPHFFVPLIGDRREVSVKLGA